MALLHTLKRVIGDFTTPADAKYAHALTTCVNSVVQHLQVIAHPVGPGRRVKGFGGVRSGG
jgi:hypothetical protein